MLSGLKPWDMVKKIAAINGKRMRTMGIMKLAVSLGSKIPGKIGGLVNKAFGNSCYTHEMSAYEGVDYQIISLKESIKRTEGREPSDKEGHRWSLSIF